MTADYHGTPTGYTNRKCRCNLCRGAWAEYIREYRRRNPEAAEANRTLQRAHGRALQRLSEKYRDEFRALVAEEMRLMREGAA